MTQESGYNRKPSRTRRRPRRIFRFFDSAASANFISKRSCYAGINRAIGDTIKLFVSERTRPRSMIIVTVSWIIELPSTLSIARVPFRPRGPRSDNNSRSDGQPKCFFRACYIRHNRRRTPFIIKWSPIYRGPLRRSKKRGGGGVT